MRGTDELRAVAAKTECANGRCEKLYRGDLDHIADRIDAEHERGMADAELSAAPTEAQLSELGYVELPKDADGVPIRFGDKVTVPWRDKVYEVRGFSYTEQLAGGQRTIWVDVYSRVKMGNVPLCGASSCRHYHKPTVEDVLTEFGVDWEHESDCEDRAALLKEYAKRLKLAKEDA